MARFGLSPYSNPVESALQSFGTGLRDISLLRDLTSGNKEREEQQRRQLTDLQITGQQQRNQEFSDEAPNREAKRQAEAGDIDQKLFEQHYGPALSSAVAKKEAWKPGQNLELSDQEVAAITAANKRTGFFSGDPKTQIEEIQAAHNLQGQLYQLKQQLAGTKKPARFGVKDHPELFQNVNKLRTVKKMFGTDKDITGFLINPSDGSVSGLTDQDKPDRKNWSRRWGSNEEKGYGWQGTFKTPDGKDASEVSVGVQIDGKEIDVPSIIPTTTPEELEWILKNAGDGKPWKTAEGHAIVVKATDFAKQRVAQGKSPFAGDDESPARQTPISEDGKTIKKVPISEIGENMKHITGFGTLLMSAGGAVHMDPKRLETVKKLQDEFEQNHAAAEVMDKIDDSLSEIEKRRQYITEMNKKGFTISKADAEERFPAKPVKNPRSGLAGKETIVNGKRVYLDDQGNPTNIVAAPKERPPVDPVTREIRQQRLDDAKSKRLSKETSDMDKKLAGEYSSEAINAIDSADDKKKLDTKNIDAVSGYLPSEKKEELDKIRTVASRLIEEDGYTAERAVREAKAAYKKRSEKSKHEAFTHNQPGHL